MNHVVAKRDCNVEDDDGVGDNDYDVYQKKLQKVEDS